MRLRTDSMICPACGKENKPSATKCVRCMQRLKNNERETPCYRLSTVESGQQSEDKGDKNVELIHNLKQTIETQQKELEKAQQQIIKATEERDQLKQSLEAMEQEQGILKKQIQQVSTERDQLKQSVEAMEQEQSILKKQIHRFAQSKYLANIEYTELIQL